MAQPDDINMCLIPETITSHFIAKCLIVRLITGMDLHRHEYLHQLTKYYVFE